VPSPGVSYVPLPDATPKAETNALASVYRLLLASHSMKKAVPDRRPNDEKERSMDDSLASTNYTE